MIPDLLRLIFNNLDTWQDIVRVAGVCREWRKVALSNAWNVMFSSMTAGYALSILRRFSFTTIAVKGVPFLQDKNNDELGKIIAKIFNEHASNSTIGTADADLIRAICANLTKKINCCHLALVHIPDIPAKTSGGHCITSLDLGYIDTYYCKSKLERLYEMYNDGKIKAIAREVQMTPPELVTPQLEALIANPTKIIKLSLQYGSRSNIEGLEYIGSNFDIVILRAASFANDEKYFDKLSCINCKVLILIGHGLILPCIQPRVKDLSVSGEYNIICPNECTEKINIIDCEIEPGVYPNVKLVRYSGCKIDAEMFPNAEIKEDTESVINLKTE